MAGLMQQARFSYERDDFATLDEGSETLWEQSVERDTLLR